MKTLEPKTVESGWLRRWSHQSFDLWSRSPLMLVIDLLAFMGLMDIVPSTNGNFNATLIILFAAPFLSWVFLNIRSMDYHSGVPLSETWEMIKDNGINIFRLTMVLFVFFLLMTLIILFFTYTPTAFVHTTTHNKAVQSMTDLAIQGGNIWLAIAYRHIGIGLSMISEPIAFPLFYLTLLIGYSLGEHVNLSYMSAFKNWRIMLFFMVIGFNGRTLFSALIIWLRPYIGENIALMMGMVVLSMMTLWFSTMGYLWCREMFEGQKENQPKLARVRSVVLDSA